MRSLLKIAGISKQGYHKHLDKRPTLDKGLISQLVAQINTIRSEHPGCGLAKMYDTIRPPSIGRDRFIKLLMNLGYRVKKARNYRRTTFSGAVRYPNLIKGLQIKNCNAIWQTDITYYQVGKEVYYITFIIDVYSKVIRGYNLGDNMKAEGNHRALQMAFGVDISIDGLIHHSDGGSQFLEKEYKGLALSRGVQMSMGQKGQDNAYAERVNGTIKNEYLCFKKIESFADLKRELARAVHHYNHKRIHRHLPQNLTPMEFERQLASGSLTEVPTVTIFDHEQYEQENLKHQLKSKRSTIFSD